jgi:selenocysteine-specific elongation factor
MRSFIVGTAGHIDHGKSALVRALTGTDPDRLPEEKRRGITIDLGFAHLSLADGLVASFIDVPGHERFVRNMLAGAHGIDAALLVVAADESVMPQTREHFHICRLLGIPRGVVALTKCDLADAESQALAELETRELVAGSFLEGAPILRVSARSGEGLAELKQALVALVRLAPERTAAGLPRLPVDRVFTLRGFGTVATGTLVSGRLSVGDELEVLPSRLRTRVRGLHVHGDAVERVGAGNRAAVNLAGLDVRDLSRGDVLTRPGSLRATSLVDVELSLLPGERPLKDEARVRVHLASAERLARVRVLSGERIEAGATGFAQLRLEAPGVAGRGDRLVLRSYSPAVTIGGGRVLDPLPAKRRRAEAAELARLAELPDAAPGRAAALLAARAGLAGLDAATLAARLTVPLPELLTAAAEPDLVSLGGEPAVFFSRDGLGSLGQRVREQVAAFHRAQPLRAGMPREELRRRALPRLPAAVADALLGRLVAAGELRASADSITLPGHAVRLSPQEEAAREKLLGAAQQAGLAGLELPQAVQAARLEPLLAERVAKLLLAEGRLQRVGESLLLHRDHLEALKSDVRRRWPAGSRLDVAGFKELTGLSRKWVIPLLEYLDRERVTRRSGTDRVVLAAL